MKALLEKVREFNKPLNEEHVALLISKLGETPSIATLEAVVKYYKASLRKILTKDLLEWMNEQDQTEFANDEVSVKIKTYVNTKMVDPEKGFKWLTDHGYADLIETSVAFPKGEFTTEAQATLEDMGLSFTRKDGVHPQSLKKIISDRLDAGEDLPDEAMGIKVNFHDECVVKGK